MPEITVVCPSCKRAVKGRELRTATFGPTIAPVCRQCFLKLKHEYGNDSQRKPQLTEQVTHSQTELPF